MLHHMTGPVSASEIPGLRLYYTDSCEPVSAQLLYAPMICIMMQGEKRVLLGSQVVRYTPEDYMICCIHLPVTGTVVNAQPAQPYVAMSMAINPDLLAELIVASPNEGEEPQPARALCIGKLSASLLDCFVRLARLLDEPSLIPTIAPLVTREILIRLLESPDGFILRQIATRETYAAGIVRAISTIRHDYADVFCAAALARIAGMSQASFNRHFRTMTGMSALQYQKRTRLQEARRQLFVQNEDAATVGFQVGYASPSQFSREYQRNFGRTPKQDAVWLRSQAAIYKPLF